MVQYQGGSRQAFDALVALAGPSLHRFFVHSVRDRQQAEDLYQDTWLKVHHARHTYRPGEAAMPWIYGIARHVVADFHRGRARRQRRLDAAQSAAGATGADPISHRPVDTHNRAEAAQLLELAMSELPENQREALILLKIEGLSVKEAARIAGTSPGALKVRAHRAYEHIRARLRSLEGGEP